MNDFRSLYKTRTLRLIKSGSYKRLTDERKKEELDKIKKEALDRALKQNKYRPKKKK